MPKKDKRKILENRRAKIERRKKRKKEKEQRWKLKLAKERDEKYVAPSYDMSNFRSPHKDLDIVDNKPVLKSKQFDKNAWIINEQDTQ